MKNKDAGAIFRNEGMSIYIKGKLVIGIHPDNLENNLNALINGDMKIDWETMKKYAETL